MDEHPRVATLGHRDDHEHLHGKQGTTASRGVAVKCVLAALCLAVLIQSCGVDDAMNAYPMNLDVLPSDTVRVIPGQAATFDAYVTRDGYGLASEVISVSREDSNGYVLVGMTDSIGHYRYPTPPLSPNSSPYAFSFVVTLNGYNRSNVVTRYVVVQALPVIQVTITANGVAGTNQLVPEPYMPLESRDDRWIFALLPRIFFDNNSSAVPVRYHPTGNPVVTSDAVSPLDLNHRLIDIVGARMQDLPTASVLLTGTNANNGSERGNVTLARSRAITVRNYLIGAWNVDSSRIQIDARNLPASPTDPVTAAGIQENRRVEISSEESRLLAPVVFDARQTIAGPVRIAFRINAPTSTASYIITADLDGKQIMTDVTGLGRPPDTIITFLHLTNGELNRPIHYAIAITDSFGQWALGDGFTRAVPRTLDRYIPHDASVWYDYGATEVNQASRLQMQSLGGDSTIVQFSLSGYIALPETDPAIAEVRATSVAELLRSLSGVQQQIEIVTPTTAIYPIDLPEGRQLDRRVEIHLTR